MAGVVGSRRDLIFVISELYYEAGSRHFVVGGKITGCRHILTLLRSMIGLENLCHLPNQSDAKLKLKSNYKNCDLVTCIFPHLSMVTRIYSEFSLVPCEICLKFVLNSRCDTFNWFWFNDTHLKSALSC